MTITTTKKIANEQRPNDDTFVASYIKETGDDAMLRSMLLNDILSESSKFRASTTCELVLDNVTVIVDTIMNTYYKVKVDKDHCVGEEYINIQRNTHMVRIQFILDNFFKSMIGSPGVSEMLVAKYTKIAELAFDN